MAMTNDDKLALDGIDALADAIVADPLRDLYKEAFNTTGGTSSNNELNLVSTVDEAQVDLFGDLNLRVAAEIVKTALPARKRAYNARRAIQGPLVLASTDTEASEFFYQDYQPGLEITTPGLTYQSLASARRLVEEVAAGKLRRLDNVSVIKSKLINFP